MAAGNGLASSSVKRQRYANRRREMIEGNWIYYPERDLYIEKLSVRSARMTPPGESRFLPRSRHVYGREVFEVDQPTWNAFLEGDPRAIIVVDAWVGHPQFAKAPSDSGLYDPQGYALHDEGTVGR